MIMEVTFEPLEAGTRERSYSKIFKGHKAAG
jgi:hypothetical protein